jgi:hypothetical protein
MDTLFLECEILDWWNAERLRVDRECIAARKRYVEKATERIDALTPVQLLHDSTARLHVERQLKSDITMFGRRMEQSLREVAAESMAALEGEEEFDGLGYGEGALLVAGGAVAAGAVGVAGAAAGVATTATVTSILGIFATGTVVTFSWPVFSAAAAVALVASYSSPAIAGWAVSKLRCRFAEHVEKLATRALVASDANSVRAGLLKALDAALERRLADLDDEK